MRKIVLALIIGLLAVAPLKAASDTYTATVTDISDRAYEPAVTKLITEAKHSITISMYAVSLGAPGNNPAKILLGNLLNAVRRGVSVTLYLNTHFRESEKARQNLIANPFLKQLQDAGSVVHIVPSGRKLHDKLIIVDSRYVVEGSSNWSIAALRDNFESDTLIDSPGLAAAKLERLRDIPLVGPEKPGEKRDPIYLQGLPAIVTLPAMLLEDTKYLADMVKTFRERSLDLYLLLVAHTQATGKREFFLDLESMGLSLGLPRTLSDSRLRQEVINCLKPLERHYGVVTVKYFHGRDARVTMTDLPGAVFTMPSDIVKPHPDNPRSTRRKFIAMVKAYLESRGETIDSISTGALAKRFGVGRTYFLKWRELLSE